MNFFRFASGKSCGVILFLILGSILLIPSSAAAFWKSKSSVKKPHSGSTETPQYRVYYKTDPSSLRSDSSDPSKKWIELYFKAVNVSGQPWGVTGRESVKIRFLDQDGFALASDFLTPMQLSGTDVYGSLWVEVDRAKNIVSADIVGVSPLEEEIEEIKKSRASRPVAPSPEPLTSPEIKREELPVASVTSPQESSLPAPVASPSPSASPVIENPAQNNVPRAPVVVPSAAPTSSSDPMLGNQGASNEEVQKILSELNKKHSLDGAVSADSPTPA